MVEMGSEDRDCGPGRNPSGVFKTISIHCQYSSV